MLVHIMPIRVLFLLLRHNPTQHLLHLRKSRPFRIHNPLPRTPQPIDRPPLNRGAPYRIRPQCSRDTPIPHHLNQRQQHIHHINLTLRLHHIPRRSILFELQHFIILTSTKKYNRQSPTNHHRSNPNGPRPNHRRHTLIRDRILTPIRINHNRIHPAPLNRRRNPIRPNPNIQRSAHPNYVIRPQYRRFQSSHFRRNSRPNVVKSPPNRPYPQHLINTGRRRRRQAAKREIGRAHV